MDFTLSSTNSNCNNCKLNLREKLVSTLNSFSLFYDINGDQSEMLKAYYLKKIDCNDLHLIFKDKFKIYIYFEDGYYFSDIDEFDRHAYGETINDLLKDIDENFYFIWNNIVKINDENLNPAALEFKKKVLNFISEK